MLGSKITSIRNFETDTIRDVEGDEIPKEKMLIFELADQTRVAVRGSGTEPKIKYYLFAQRRPEGAHFARAEAIKPQVEQTGGALAWLQADARERRSTIPVASIEGRSSSSQSHGAGIPCEDFRTSRDPSTALG